MDHFNRLYLAEAQLAIAIKYLERIAEYEDPELGVSLEAKEAFKALAEIKKIGGKQCSKIRGLNPLDHTMPASVKGIEKVKELKEVTWK